MKEKYLKYKKYIRSFLALGVTVGSIGLFGLFSKNLLFGLILIIIGSLFLLLTTTFIKKTIKIEEECTKLCPCCKKEVVINEETRYYVSNNLVSEEDFNNFKGNFDKIKRVITYYKCQDCNFCFTIIKSYSYYGDKEIQLNDKRNMDFNYEGQY